MTTEFFIPTERAIPRLLWRALWRRPTCIVDTDVESRSGFFRRIIVFLMSRGGVKSLLRDRRDLMAFRDIGDYQRLCDPLSDLEPWMEAYLRFDNSDRCYGRYGQAFRHIACNRIFRRAYDAYAMREIGNHPDAALRGADVIDRDLQQHLFGGAGPVATPSSHSWVNGYVALITFLFTVAWVISRIRIRPPAVQNVVLGSDFLGGERDSLLWHEVSEDPRDILVVFRDKQAQRDAAGKFDAWPSCLPDNGAFGLPDGLSAIAEASADCLRLVWAGRRLPSDMFRPLVALPWKRMKYRALCRLYRFQFYWGRDDYNVDHIMRSQELRRIGAKSIGIMHGLPCISERMAQMLHIDFDIYFVHGTDVAQRFGRHWPRHMAVHAVGTACLSRGELQECARPPSNDMVVIVSPSFHEDAVFVAIRKLAEAFPDRTIYLNVKRNYLAGDFGRKYREITTRGPSNIVDYPGRSYDLLLRCRYLFSESTTLVAEAVQLGRIAFCWDLDRRSKFLNYRRFPGLSVRSAEELCERVREVEAGTWQYPRAQWGALIDLTGRVVWDRIRDAMGLPAGTRSRFAHLVFVAANPDVSSPRVLDKSAIAS
jgi:hypothetical protein